MADKALGREPNERRAIAGQLSWALPIAAFLVKNRVKLAESFERLAQTPGLGRIIVSHHRSIEDEPAEVRRRVAASL